MITIDYNFVIDEIIGKNGLSLNDLNILNKKAKNIHDKIKKGNLGFIQLLNQNLQKIYEKLKEFQEKFKNFVVFGIGGSALGTKAIYQACGNNKKNLNVIDNIDPDYFKSFIEKIDISNTLFIIISKSGKTSETISQFLIIKDLLEKNFKEKYKERLIIITDPEKGGLRKFARNENILSFEVPENVGGRFSVLSPVGLVPLYLAEISIENLIEGAKNIYKNCQSDDIFSNPSYLSGAIQYLSYLNGKKISVIMPYSSKLEYFAEWFRQLWAESLGKNEKVGPTPVKAIGVTDQHSQLQLFMDGPNDKIITFIEIENFENIVKIPELKNYEDFEFLYGKSLNQLFKTEFESVKIALAKKGKLNYTIKIDKLNEFTMGELILFFELQTVFTGFLFNINPFDQPGVEEGKNFTYGLMGKKGYENKKKEFYKFKEKLSDKFILKG